MDGVCCESACELPCYSCSLPGRYGQCFVEPAGVDLHGDCSLGNTCVATCDGAGNCIDATEAAMCVRPECVDEVTSLGPAFCQGPLLGCAVEERVNLDCTPYICAFTVGTCRESCTKNEHCANGFGCNVDGRCVPPPLPQYGGCNVTAPEGEGNTPWLVLAAAGALGLCRRPRRRPGSRHSTEYMQ
ncbi:hypothetical protein [Polyangium sp. 15x6]|uniref:hypothetical protein n=1 Tax=Polyangium sp. 15x6 TaxID=3042687 RepID=UPI00249C46FE|nr:hypothetical protein [Polyangium sp. 15x6]MDI3287735.1 hypothetical protein [Polyangium sp. 15x6]